VNQSRRQLLLIRTLVICAFIELVKIYSESYSRMLYIAQKKKRKQEKEKKETEQQVEKGTAGDMKFQGDKCLSVDRISQLESRCRWFWEAPAICGY
jgi:hypothetical protein